MRIVGAALGDCVHVAGVANFLRLAEECGHEAIFLGPAVSVEELVGACVETDPDMIAVGYRLTPANAAPLFQNLKQALVANGLAGKRLVFGGTPPVCQVARGTGLFEQVFDGSQGIEEIRAFLGGRPVQDEAGEYPQSLVERIRWKKPRPVIRHHFGLPSFEETLEGVARIAEARCLDVLSIGNDQASQEAFFRPEARNPETVGAGGVPLRAPEDLRALYRASRRGNYPLMRCYSGTNDVLQWAELLVETINNAWCANPLTWYSELDGRGPRSLLQTIRDCQALMAWHGQRGIPFESNESHHWSMRDAHDTVAVVMAFLPAYNAKVHGVKHYVAQYMLNVPPGTSPLMDLAKMLAKKELIGSLVDGRFQVLTEVRAGLPSFPPDPGAARGQLGYATFLAMALEPDIYHVVASCEAHHAARPDDVIESCRLAQQVIDNALRGLPDMTLDPRVQARKEELLREARVLLGAIHELGKSRGAADPWADPATLYDAVRLGLIDAPQLANTSPARGRVVTRVVAGACRAVDPRTGRPLSEEERLAALAREWKEAGAA